MEPATGTPAPYGHACSGCARAKCRCVTRVEGSCERCHRLRKECTPAALVRKRRLKKPSPAARRSQLEDKLSDLVSLLQAQHSQPPVGGPSQDPLVSPALPYSTTGASVADESTRDGRDINYQIPTPITMASKSTAHVSPASNNDELYVDSTSQTKAAQDLHTFRTHHLACFPLLYISADTTVEHLQRERPFLWSTIQAVCARSPATQSEFGIQVRKKLVNRVIVEGERNIDLLLAFLVISCWSFYFARGKPFLGMSSNIAKAMIIDLRLDRPAGVSVAEGSFALVQCQKPWTFLDPPDTSRHRTNEERRALLACFVLTATLSYLSGHDHARWGQQMDEAIRILAEQPECPGDEVLVAIARISKVSEDAATLIRFGPEDTEGTGPVLIHVQSLRHCLDKVRNSLSPNMLSNKTVLSYLYSAQVMIHEIALLQLPASPFYGAFDLKKIEYLHTCAQSVKYSLDNFVSLDVAQFTGINFARMLHFSHSIQVLHRLSCLQHPGWDRQLVRTTVDEFSYLEQIALLFEQADAHRRVNDSNEETTVFAKGAEVMRCAGPIWAAALEKLDNTPTQFDPDMPVRQGIDETLMDFADETWFTDILGSWNV